MENNDFYQKNNKITIFGEKTKNLTILTVNVLKSFFFDIKKGKSWFLFLNQFSVKKKVFSKTLNFTFLLLSWPLQSMMTICPHRFLFLRYPFNFSHSSFLGLLEHHFSKFFLNYHIFWLQLFKIQIQFLAFENSVFSLKDLAILIIVLK